jgi:hypothetical protein
MAQDQGPTPEQWHVYIRSINEQFESELCASSPTGKHVIDGVGDAGDGVAICCRYCDQLRHVD